MVVGREKFSRMLLLEPFIVFNDTQSYFFILSSWLVLKIAEETEPGRDTKFQ